MATPKDIMRARGKRRKKIAEPITAIEQPKEVAVMETEKLVLDAQIELQQSKNALQKTESKSVLEDMRNMTADRILKDIRSIDELESNRDLMEVGSEERMGLDMEIIKLSHIMAKTWINMGNSGWFDPSPQESGEDRRIVIRVQECPHCKKELN